jgi:hypothetical protein
LQIPSTVDRTRRRTYCFRECDGRRLGKWSGYRKRFRVWHLVPQSLNPLPWLDAAWPAGQQLLLPDLVWDAVSPDTSAGRFRPALDYADQYAVARSRSPPQQTILTALPISRLCFYLYLCPQFRPTYSLVILAQAGGFSTARKFDSTFRFCRHAIASCRAISPCADGKQDIVIARGASAFEYERAVHPAVSADDEAHFDFHPTLARNQHWIRRCQRLWRSRALAARTLVHMRDIAKLGNSSGRLPKLPFPFVQRAKAQSCGLHRSQGCADYCEYRKP